MQPKTLQNYGAQAVRIIALILCNMLKDVLDIPMDDIQLHTAAELYEFVISFVDLDNKNNNTRLQNLTHTLLWELLSGRVAENCAIACPSDIALVLHSIGQEDYFIEANIITQTCAAF